MGLFGSIGRLARDVVGTPVAVAKDVATMGGLLTDQDETYSTKHARRVARHVAKALEDEED